MRPKAVPSELVTRIMLSLAEITPDSRVLEIGTGTGFQTQIFASTGCELHSIEIEPVDGLSDKLPANVYLHTGDGKQGLKANAPYDAILVTCGLESVPESLVAQMKDGGRLVAPVGNAGRQELRKYSKRDGKLKLERVGAYTRFQMAV